MPAFDRSHSFLQMNSPLGPDVLIPTALSAEEAISQPFAYRVNLVSEQGDIDPDQVLHRPGGVTLRRDLDAARYFQGIFQEFAIDGMPRLGIYSYHAVLVPKLWFLSQTMDCRVYQDLSVVEILQRLFQDAQVDDVDFRIFSNRTKRQYTVQFNETDLQFASRLMEEAGYFYFFEHSEDSHTLVVADANSAFHAIPDAVLRFDSLVEAEDVLPEWNRPRATAHGVVTQKDYDPTSPGKRLEATDQTKQKADGTTTRDVFSWPAATHDMNTVADRSRFAIEAADAAVSVVSGSGSFRGLVAGGQITIIQDPLSGQNGATYVVRSLRLTAVDNTWTTGGAPMTYTNRFDAFPTTSPWRQPATVPRPAMAGIHSAIVIGPDGEEIYTDDLGRVKVRFFWDRRKEATADKACWARVVQPWAGNKWGVQFIPRVGAEVAVAFIDGDADRPVVMGGLYNGNDSPIYSAAEKTKSGLRTRSTLAGGTMDFNELTFEDKKGEELVYLHAQKDLTTEVEHDEALQVDNCRTAKVGKDETISVGNAQSVTVGNGRTTSITQSNDQLTVRQGNLQIDVSMGQATMTAMQSIELRVGSSVVRIDPSGISISGTVISITGDASVEVSAPMVRISGDGMTVISGGLVEIN